MASAKEWQAVVEAELAARDPRDGADPVREVLQRILDTAAAGKS